MQLKHETQLIESLTLKPEEFNFSNELQQTKQIDNNKLIILKQNLDEYTLNQIKLNSINYISSCPIGNLIAVYLNNSQQIVLIDTRTYLMRERFPLKSCDKKFSKYSFSLKGIDFSPDGLKLAIGQTDCIIYIYKLPNYLLNQFAETTTRPTITGKFVCSSPVTCLIWTECGIIFGTQDGKVKLILLTSGNRLSSIQNNNNNNQQLLSNNESANLLLNSTTTSSSSSKVITIYNNPKGFMPISLAFKYPFVVIGFIDNNIQLISLGNRNNTINDNTTINPSDSILNQSLQRPLSSSLNQQQQQQQQQQNLILENQSIMSRRNSSQPTIIASLIGSIKHFSPPHQLAIIQNNIICSSSSDGIIYFHYIDTDSNNNNNNIKLLQEINLKENILAFDYSNLNEIFAIVTENLLLFVRKNVDLNNWQLQESYIELKELSMLSITTIKWLKDGSQLVMGTLNGSVELFQCSYGIDNNNSSTINKFAINNNNNKFEIYQISKDRIRLTNKIKNFMITYKSQFDIERIYLFNKYESIIIFTKSSIILANINYFELLQSEINWNYNPKNNRDEKFSFKHFGYVLIFNESLKELNIIKLGKNSILHTINNSKQINKNLISIRQYPNISINYEQQQQQQQQNGNNDNLISNHRNFEENSPTRENNIFLEKINKSQQSSLMINNQLEGEEEIFINENKNKTFDDNLTKIENKSSKEQNITNYFNDYINEKLAYVNELNNSIIVINLKTKSIELTYKYDYNDQVDFLELSNTTNYLIFRYKISQKLNLIQLIENNYNNKKNEKKEEEEKVKVILDNCEYVKWLTNSDILIAQSKNNILIWYNIENLNELTKLDSRSFNITKSSPILDLSLLSNSSANNKKSYPTILKVTSEFILLSNLEKILLNKLKVKFYTELVGGNLENSLEILLLSSKLKSINNIDDDDDDENSSDFLTDKMRNNLLTKLGWLAINKGNCLIAKRAFEELNYISMVNYLEKCLNLNDLDECNCRLAILKGDWNEFEQISTLENVINTYKRLNKWSRLISYLNNKQQFRQKDLIEQEYKNWLINKNRILEASEMLATKFGDLFGAIELLLNKEKFSEATELFIREIDKISFSNSNTLNNNNNKMRKNFNDTNLIELAEKLKLKLLESNDFNNVAKLCDKILGQFNEAIEFYIKANNFKDAIIVAKSISINEEDGEEKNKEKIILNLEESFGNYLLIQFRENKLSRKKALNSIKHFIEAKKFYRALMVSIEMNDFKIAYEIIVNHMNEIKNDLVNNADDDDDNDSGNKLKLIKDEYSKLIVDFMLKNERFDEAINVLIICENYEKVVELLINNKQPDYKRAFEIALNNLFNNNKTRTIEYFIKIANELTDNIDDDDDDEINKIEQAEKIYLISDKPELAIELNKKFKNYDRMLNLIEQFQPDLLESNLLLLAREMETLGKFDQAEKYLLKSSDSEWTNVVRMYRLANKWSDAYRVAKNYCSSEKDPLLVQLAYWWSKSIYQQGNLIEAQMLLKKLNVFNLVIEFCCDNKNYLFAIELCNENENENENSQEEMEFLKSKQNDIVKRYAQFLEEMHKFESAEELLIKYNQINDAINMYIDNDLYQDAIRIVENQLNNKSQQANIINGNIFNNDYDNLNQQKELVDLLNDTLIKCADRIAEDVNTSKQQQQQQQQQSNQTIRSSTSNSSLLNISQKSVEKLQKAQQLYLRAQRPDLAVNLYKDRGMWQEAIQVAQRFAPQLLESVEIALDNQVLDDISPIVAQVVNQKQQQQQQQQQYLLNNQSRSSSSSRSSLLSYQSSKNEQMKQQQQQQQISISRNESTSKQFNGNNNYNFQNNVDISIKSGDLKGAKLALNKFMTNLADGNDSGFAGDDSHEYEMKLNYLLKQFERLTSTSVNIVDNYKQIIYLADKIIYNLNWGTKQMDDNNNQKMNKICSILRDNLLNFYLKKELKFNNNVDSEEDEKETSYKQTLNEEIKLRLLVSHYVTLHSILLNNLYINNINLNQEFTTQLSSNSQQTTLASSVRLSRRHPSVTSRIDTNSAPKRASWPLNLSPIQADKLRDFLLSNNNNNNNNNYNKIKRNNNSKFNITTCNSEIINLISKLSLSLLRYTDILEPKLAFHVSGFWLLVANRRDLARFVWTRLIELVDEDNEKVDDQKESTDFIYKNTTRFFGNGSTLEFELQRAGIPLIYHSINDMSSHENSPYSNNNNNNIGSDEKKYYFFDYKISSTILNEIRQWLVETLIESSSSRLSLDDRGLIECSLNNPSSIMTTKQTEQQQRKQYSPCLVSGYPIFPNNNKQLDKSNNNTINRYVRLNEWNILLSIKDYFELKNNDLSSSSSANNNNNNNNQVATSLKNEIEFITKFINTN